MTIVLLLLVLVLRLNPDFPNRTSTTRNEVIRSAPAATAKNSRGVDVPESVGPPLAATDNAAIVSANDNVPPVPEAPVNDP